MERAGKRLRKQQQRLAVRRHVGTGYGNRSIKGIAPPLSLVRGNRAPLGVYTHARARGNVPPPEKKTVDTNIGLNFDTNSAVANSMKLLNTIPTGNSAITRNGKSVTLKAVAIHGVVSAASATLVQKCVLLLIYIRNPNQAATLPAWTEIMATQEASALTNRDNASKYKILRRWEIEISGNSTTPATGREQQVFNEYIPLHDMPSVWTAGDSTGVIADFVKGALILASLGNSANGATTTPTFSGNSRVYFSDP